MANPTRDSQLTLVWESELLPAANGRMELVARRPLSVMSSRQAAKVLCCSPLTVGRLFQAGHLRGFKPGAIRVRRDGRASNASLKLDSESVLVYKERQMQAARDYQDARSA